MDKLNQQSQCKQNISWVLLTKQRNGSTLGEVEVFEIAEPEADETACGRRLEDREYARTMEKNTYAGFINLVPVRCTCYAQVHEASWMG